MAYMIYTKSYSYFIPWLDELIAFEGQRVKVKVAARLYICVNYCGRGRHTHRCFGVGSIV